MPERPAGDDLDSAQLANPRAERVKRVAALAGRSARSRAGLFLVEGPQGVREAVLFAAPRVRDLYVTPDAAARYRSIVTAASDAGLYVHFGTDEVLRAMSADCQGILAVVETAGVSLDEALAGSPRLVAVLADVRDPGNAGTVIRAADAAGAAAVVLAGESVDVFNPKVVRATAGSLFHLPVVRGGSLAETVAALRAAGLTVLGTDGTGEIELRPDHAVLAGSIAWVFGNEAHGLSSEDLESADHTVRIPISGKAESLNLATAAAVCLYASAWAHRS
ncbi:MAG: RNA methyltransferase [Demequina sp.]|nr:RNA methyltransferase [Demequina sp.]